MMAFNLCHHYAMCMKAGYPLGAGFSYELTQNICGVFCKHAYVK